MSDGTPDVDLKGSLTKKLGPLPGWVWVLLVGGGAWAAYAWTRSRAVSPSSRPQQSASAAGGYTTDGFSSSSSGIIPTGGSLSGGAAGSPSVTSNGQWARQTEDALIATGADPSLVTNALSKYLQGGQLTAGEKSIIDSSLVKYGSPPEGIIPINSSSGSGNPATTYTVQNGDTLKQVLQNFYGQSDPVTARLVADANNLQWTGQDATSFNLAPGQTLALPTNGIFGYQANTLKPSVYVVKPGDTLSSIAQSHYGDPTATGRVTSANPGMGSLTPGQTIVVP